MSSARSTNDWLTASTPGSSANSRHARSCSGERADAEFNARQIEPLARTQLAADSNGALHVIARDPLDPELHEAIVEKNPVIRFHHARHASKLIEAPRIANDFLIREHEMRARREMNRFRIDFPEAQFRARKICHDRHASAGFACCVTDALNNFRVFGRLPCEKFNRATSSPARISRASMSGDSDAGPMVATILVLCAGSAVFMTS